MTLIHLNNNIIILISYYIIWVHGQIQCIQLFILFKSCIDGMFGKEHNYVIKMYVEKKAKERSEIEKKMDEESRKTACV